MDFENQGNKAQEASPKMAEANSGGGVAIHHYYAYYRAGGVCIMLSYVQ
jgi:hypothetical protein